MSKLEKLGALWIKRSKKGLDFMTGEFKGEKIVVFKKQNKTDKQPDFEIFKSEPLPARETTDSLDEVKW